MCLIVAAFVTANFFSVLILIRL